MTVAVCSETPSLNTLSVANVICERLRTLARLVGGLVAAETVMMLLGFGWLAFGAQMAAGTTGVGLAKAFAYGVQPFILGDLVKLALVACLARAGWSLLQRRG